VSEQREPAPPLGSGRVRPDRIDESVTAFARLFAAHAAHLFEYCCTLTGSDAVAADATVAALAAPEHLPEASHLLRARLFAIARQVAVASAEAEHPWLANFGVDGSRDLQGPGVLAVLRHLPARYREVLVLVYRHGIWPEQLPEVLGVFSREAYERLAAAEQEFVNIAATVEPADTQSVTRAALEDVAAIPLAAVPGSVWRRAVADLAGGTSRWSAIPAAARASADWHTGPQTRSRTRPSRRLRLAAAAAALPVAAIGCWAIANDGGPPRPALSAAGSALGLQPVSSPSGATPEGVGTGPAKQTPAPSGQGSAPTGKGGTPTVPILALLPSTPSGTVLPIASPTASVGTADPTPSTPAPSTSAAQPSPSSSADSPSPSPSPSDSATESPSVSSSPADSSSAAPSPSDSAS
jgi:DNA-directed RNA polymerase specialized sigma24 family protein